MASSLVIVKWVYIIINNKKIQWDKFCGEEQVPCARGDGKHLQ
jgi:hypothetical protein